MKPERILRVATGLAFVQYALHAHRFFTASPKNLRLQEVYGAMASYSFVVTGLRRTVWDFYYGYGVLAVLLGVIEIVGLWQIAKLAENDVESVRPLVALFVFANLAHAAVALRYFFLVPVAFDLPLAALLAWAWIASGRAARARGMGVKNGGQV
jgi:hypothetical protein